MTIPEAFELALKNHQDGRLADAEGLYRQILAVQPHHADALHLLGVIAHQVGRHELAVEWIRQAVVLGPDNSVAHYNLGEACRTTGRLDEAVEAFSRALRLKPDYPEAHNNLGAALAGRGQFSEAIASFRRALELKPDFPEAHNNLGIAFKELGRFDESVAAYRHALKLKPLYPEAFNNLGAALAGEGRFEEAEAAYHRALELKPDYPECDNNLGASLAGHGQYDEAMTVYRRALMVKPDFPETYNNLGEALRARGQLDEAIAACRRAIELKSSFPEAHNTLGNALRERGRFDEAAAACRRAIELKPDYAEAHNSLGNALRERGRIDEAVTAYRRALELKPGDPEAHNNLGAALAGQGEIDGAILAYRRALELQPEHAWVHSNLLYTLHFRPGHNAGLIDQERQRWNRQFGEPAKRLMRPHANDRDQERPLRVGYVSPDFRDHVVGRNLLPLFQCHDRRSLEIFCYAGVVNPDRVTDAFREHARQWRSTVGMADDALAEMIRRDGVDILVDLSQHLAGNRLPMFARQPAPVQVSFAGYPESTGLEAMEYRISDRYLEAVSVDEGTAGKEHVSMIESFWCYDPCGVDVEINDLPARESGRVTFGCLGNFCKVNAPVLRLWARVLGKVKNSRLVIGSPAGSHRERTLEVLEREGIERQRVEFVDFLPRREYLELYRRLDIVLDTFPYNGHTTSLDALWMGVPVVTLTGRTPVSRAGLSQLSNLGLPELAAQSESEYVNIAESLAGDLPRLAQLRSTLRERMQTSPLMDAPRFAEGIEAAYRSMWKRWSAAGTVTSSPGL